MGMTATLYGVRDHTLGRLHAEPALVWQLLAPDDPEAVAQAVRNSESSGWLASLFGRKRKFSVPAPLELDSGEGLVADLDKAWHGLHYLFTGTAWEGEPPLNFIAAGGEALEHASLDGVTVNTFDAAHTARIAAALQQLSEGELRRRFDAHEMMALEIYPAIWERALDPNDSDDPLGYCVDTFPHLRDGVVRAAQAGYGLVIYIG